MKKATYLLVLIILTLYAIPSYGVEVKTSTQIASGNWNNVATWQDGVVPTSADSVTVNDGFTLTIDPTAECNALSVSIGAGAWVVFDPDGVTGSTLTVRNNISMSEGSSWLN